VLWLLVLGAHPSLHTLARTWRRTVRPQRPQQCRSQYRADMV